MIDRPLSSDDISQDIMSVRYVIFSQRNTDSNKGYKAIENSISQAPVHWQDKGEKSAAIRIFENTRSLPIAWLVEDVKLLTPYRILKAIETGFISSTQASQEINVLHLLQGSSSYPPN